MKVLVFQKSFAAVLKLVFNPEIHIDEKGI